MELSSGPVWYRLYFPKLNFKEIELNIRKLIMKAGYCAWAERRSMDCQHETFPQSFGSWYHQVSGKLPYIIVFSYYWTIQFHKLWNKRAHDLHCSILNVRCNIHVFIQKLGDSKIFIFIVQLIPYNVLPLLRPINILLVGLRCILRY